MLNINLTYRGNCRSNFQIRNHQKQTTGRSAAPKFIEEEEEEGVRKDVYI
jgi:hypothetical protein